MRPFNSYSIGCDNSGFDESVAGDEELHEVPGG